MGHLTLELILWLLLAFFIGCTLGCLFRKLFGGSSSEATPPVAEKKEVEAEKSAEPEAKPQVMPAVATGVAKRPKGLAAAREGKADELQRLSGIGAKIEKTLHSLGYFHYDQIASWSPDEVQWVDEHLRFKGRIDRENWIPQAKLLADGNEEKFAELYGSGGVKDKKTAKSESGSKTKKS